MSQKVFCGAIAGVALMSSVLVAPAGRSQSSLPPLAPDPTTGPMPSPSPAPRLEPSPRPSEGRSPAEVTPFPSEPLPRRLSAPAASPSPIPDTSAVNQLTGLSSGYLLGPGDQVDLNVYEYPEFTGPRVVLPDGTIALPLVGSVMAANRTPDELAQDLTQKLSAWLVNPVVSIGLTRLRPVRINVSGEVQRPGPVQLRSPTDFENSTVISELPTVGLALLQAGGVTREADLRSITVQRILPGGRVSAVNVNLWEALISEEAPSNLILQDGDSVYVPTLAEGDPLDRRLIARSSIAPERVRVRVVGEVKQPGEVLVPPNSSISGAIAIAGGPTDKGSLKHVRFVRMEDNGRISEQELDLRQLNDTYQIQDGDVVYVAKKDGFRALDVVGPLVSPLNFLLNLLRGS
ncbi:polysaccharide biosynthesis/export family protein [Geitlerinema sp. PCC 7407]|uniref:polysaccharide biosynthesis/export family protein n=1 Tax=Geitlerinema sp. PCC 7407 TaxID=1173025 RepID=UPI00029FFA53|nr:polysaccharide biosynthesis/export family protein [Geitlerinema sp. PCC 7407]AFY66516.1 polysaccharide export protein [Geitlerinema sp. PCC 7407]